MNAIKLLGSLMGNRSLASGLGSQLLSGLLGGGGQQQQASQSSGLAGILGSVMGGQQQSGGGGGGMLSGLLGSVMGGGGQSSGGAGGIAGLVGSMMGGGDQSSGEAGGIAGLVGGMLGGGEQEAAAPAPQQAELQQANDQAILMIRAMVNAAKSDGRVDETEQQNIISKLGDDVSQAEIDFLKQEFAAPLDVASFAASVPNGLEQQIYALSLTSIDLDTQNEAQYLGQLAQGLNIDPNVCNQIHDQVGAPKIFG